MIKNARITSTMLGREDHGIMTFFVFVGFDGDYCCGIGGYCLDEYDKEIGRRVFCAKSMEVISKILEVVGVNKWEDLPGKYIRIEENGWGSSINKIGNIIEDKWLDIPEFFALSEVLQEREERSKGCEFCRKDYNSHKAFLAVSEGTYKVLRDIDSLCDIKFCPMCGRPLKGEAHD